ncbi:transcriptional regulator [Dinoroseobacter shibae DFL 12 = DSM 16493]|jgi:DNA-binding IclR family transcriptional regulator|uniref:Transcriptional regulator n=2 Tax=Pseudomonadota TaxID=1224 RepID=A8LR02_DINSH|nr:MULTISPECIES: IclR family transcriptional regulator [Dinoroseobacter]ABV92545.1 transcriptional regulator [Dinoroseobacter shibae DFL 12 = DSM 16493]MDD9718193.1 IclR family transcriptional regulator [Dinoroseobacter sp. PD6]URF47487.1 IclR family transcriptional regulator [Dinoroseobacter shibae]URF51798.1 IclR family transcriptional regulator [Dinoroseobacter shibae]
MPEVRPPPDDKAQIPTNLRLLRVIEEVAKAGVPVLPGALVEALGLPKPTVHRLLTTAEEEGFVQRHVDGRSYGPGVRLRQVAAHTLSSERVRTERLLIMRALAEAVEETCNLAAPGRYGMVYLDRVETHWPLRIQLPIGTQVPFHCTASGKCYLASLRADKLARLISALPLERQTPHTLTEAGALRAELAETRTRGYSVDHEEFMDGMCAIAVPIHDTEDRFLTALAIHAPMQRHSPDSLAERALAPLQEAAGKLSALLV